MTNMMGHRVDVWRPNMAQDSGQRIDGYAREYTAVPAFVQPADAKLEMYYSQRGTTVTHTIYTTATDREFRRNDILEMNGKQFHLIAGPRDALEAGLFLELHAEEYTEGAKKMLDKEAYQ